MAKKASTIRNNSRRRFPYFEFYVCCWLLCLPLRVPLYFKEVHFPSVLHG